MGAFFHRLPICGKASVARVAHSLSNLFPRASKCEYFFTFSLPFPLEIYSLKKDLIVESRDETRCPRLNWRPTFDAHAASMMDGKASSFREGETVEREGRWISRPRHCGLRAAVMLVCHKGPGCVISQLACIVLGLFSYALDWTECLPPFR